MSRRMLVGSVKTGLNRGTSTDKANYPRADSRRCKRYCVRADESVIHYAAPGVSLSLWLCVFVFLLFSCDQISNLLQSKAPSIEY